MKRETQIDRLRTAEMVWDFIVVGGGATGLGCAVDAASRGYKVAVLEQYDFAKCTSSRSTKLVHGGVRYLQKGDVMLVLEALRERGRMKANAPHLVKDQAFVISNYRYWDNFLYFCGLAFYDILSFGFGYGRSKFITAKSVMKRLPTGVKKGLKGGIVYHDGQFDDSRMAVNLAQTCIDHGGVAVNHVKVMTLEHDAKGNVCGVQAMDVESGEVFSGHLNAVDEDERTSERTLKAAHTSDKEIGVVLSRLTRTLIRYHTGYTAGHCIRQVGARRTQLGRIDGLDRTNYGVFLLT